MSRRKKTHADGTPVPRRGHVARVRPSESALKALEALTDGLPEPLRAFRDLGLIGASRRGRIEAAISHRTRTLVPVLHEVHDPHNQAAVIRSAEALGVLELHLVESVSAPFRPSRRVTQSAHRWTETHRHRDPGEALKHLRARGLRVLATALRPDAQPLHEVDFARPTALLFGNEARGLPDALIADADGAVALPIYGLAQSYNVSVAVALALAHAVEQRRLAWGSPGDLSQADRELLRLRYYRKAARKRIPPTLRASLDALESRMLETVRPEAPSSHRISP